MTCLWVGAAFLAAGGFVRVEAGNVFADEGVACDKSDEDSAGVVSRLWHLGLTGGASQQGDWRG
jgi:hypothetical protein